MSVSTAAILDGIAERMTMSEAAKKARVSIATCWRWCLRGIGGVKLRTVKIGGRRFVTADDLADFVAATTAAANGEPIPSTPAAVVRRQAKRRAAVNRECESLGI